MHNKTSHIGLFSSINKLFFHLIMPQGVYLSILRIVTGSKFWLIFATTLTA